MNKLLIFDQDGTIIDSFPAFYMAMKEACSKYGKHLDEKFVRSRIGTHSSRAILSSVLKKNIAILHEEYLKRLSNYDDKRKIYPKVIPVIESLKSDYHIAMISAKSTEKAIYHCKNLGIEHLFEKILGSPLKGKETQIQTLMKEYDIKGENTVMIGDSITDIRSGKIAGTNTILCLYGYGEKNQELLSIAHKKVRSFEEIPQKLRELF
jgi:phosphoglycolate phosphatase-like HAD superfamily hydrolase